MINCTAVFPEYYIYHTEDTMPKFCSLTKTLCRNLCLLTFFPFKILFLTHIKAKSLQKIMTELYFDDKNKSNKVSKYILKHHQ